MLCFDFPVFKAYTEMPACFIMDIQNLPHIVKAIFCVQILAKTRTAGHDAHIGVNF